jgi:exodeoxyribonuclease III
MLQFGLKRMKLLSWNIEHGGGARIPRIVGAIAAHDPAVIALSEFRSRSGVALTAALKVEGWPYAETTNPVGIDNGICVVSRTPMIRTRPCAAPPENRVRWLDIDLPEHGFGLAVLHILCSVPRVRDQVRGEAKTRFWNAVLGAAEARLREPFLFIGDFNTGAHGEDETGKTFYCAEHFGNLSALGCTDLWRHHNPGVTEWTWYSKFKGGAPGNGFRLDHAFATPSLTTRVRGCTYSHVEREAGVSDHSMVIVEVR